MGKRIRRKRRKSSDVKDPAMQFTDDDIAIVRFYLFQILQAQDKMTGSDLYNLTKDYISVALTESSFKMCLGLNFKNDRIPGYRTAKGRYGGIFLEDEELASTDLLDSPPTKRYDIVEDEPGPEDIKAEDNISEESSSKDEVIKLPDESSSKDEVIKLPDYNPAIAAIPQPQVSSLRRKDPEKVVDPFRASKKVDVIINGVTFSVPIKNTDLMLLIEKIFDGEEDLNGKIEYIGKRYACNDYKTLSKFIFYFFGGAVDSQDFGSIVDGWKKKEENLETSAEDLFSLSKLLEHDKRDRL